MDLNNIIWGEFVFDKIFSISSTNSGIDKNKLINISGTTPYITRSDKNNGVDFFIGEQIEKYEKNAGNVITIGLDTQTVFYQSSSFYTGQNVQILSNDKINYYNSLFLIPLIKKQMEKFNWGGNGATLTRLKRSKILLPINSLGEPDYDFMQHYTKQKETILLEKYKKHISFLEQCIEINSKVVWKPFKIGDVFTISTGTLLAKEFLKKGNTARLTATDNNNGIFEFYEDVEHKNYRALSNFISVSFLGSVFYHPYSASLDMKIHAIQIPDIELNRYIAEFLVFCFKRMASGFSYGDQLSSTDLPKKKILLPTNEKGEPDYLYMENYMKALEYEKLKLYLHHKIDNATNRQ
jgi:hypothetical protein